MINASCFILTTEAASDFDVQHNQIKAFKYKH